MATRESKTTSMSPSTPQKGSFRCATRAIKNARFLQRVAPDLMPCPEHADGFGSVIPFSVLERLHLMSDTDRELAQHEELRTVLKKTRPPKAQATAAAPHFSGTLAFVAPRFRDTTSGIADNVPPADIATAQTYAALACPPISAYASLYGGNNLVVGGSLVGGALTLAVRDKKYRDQDVQDWTNQLAKGFMQGEGCVIWFNPPTFTNVDCDPLVAGGYHASANIPYIFINVPQYGFTLDDPNDLYAEKLSHEIAEMTVDPIGNSSNPEVCDPCSGCPGNANWRAFFDTANQFIRTCNVMPPAFRYGFYIESVVPPNQWQQGDCSANQVACTAAPPNYPAMIAPPPC
jgi:hypothetical protein